MANPTHYDPSLRVLQADKVSRTAGTITGDDIVAAAPAWRGTATLVAGTVAVTLTGLSTSGNPQIQLKTPAGTLGNDRKAVCTTNTLTITSVVAAGTIQVLDTSTVFYVVWAT